MSRTPCPYCPQHVPDLARHISIHHPAHEDRESHGITESPKVKPERARKILRALYGGRCLACGRREPEIRITVDHIIPLSRGGTNALDNLQPLCADCNEAKANTIIDYRFDRMEPVLPAPEEGYGGKRKAA